MNLSIDYKLENYLKVDVKGIENKNVRSKSSNTQGTNEVLGYRIDSKGYFTDEFNKAAGIPSDYKIHSSTMQEMIKGHTDYKPFNIPLVASIDIAKTIGNAFRVFSQLVGDEKPKSSFSIDEIAELPFIYQYNTSTLEVSKTLSIEQSTESNIALLLRQDEQSEFSQTVNVFLDGFFDDERGIILNKNEMQKYTDDEGNINAGGLLFALVNMNSLLVEKETTIMGKMLGSDRHTNSQRLNEWFHKKEFLSGSMAFGEKDFMELMKGTNLDEFKAKYQAYKEKQSEEDEGSIKFDDVIKEIRKLLEMLFGKKLRSWEQMKDKANSLDIKL